MIFVWALIPWSIGESNPWPQQCECCALPTALIPLMGLSEINSKNYKIILDNVKYASLIPVSDSPESEDSVTAYNIKTEIKQQQKHLSDEELELIAQKYLAGTSTYDLAQEFGCHRYTISNNLKRMGIDVSGHVEGRKYKTEEVIRLYTEEHKSVRQIAQMFGICDGTIYKCLKRNNISTKRTRWDYE